MYAGRFVNQEEIGRATDGLICLEEYTPPNAMMLPNYVASLTRYTEKDCRQLCRQIAEIIKLSHESGMAHRNIHLNNFFVDSAVRCRSVLPMIGSIHAVVANSLVFFFFSSFFCFLFLCVCLFIFLLDMYRAI
jgi:serine/threonine protein kinase